MSDEERPKKDRPDIGTKRQRMRAAVTAGHARANPDRGSTDEADTASFKRGSSDRKQRPEARHNARGV